MKQGQALSRHNDIDAIAFTGSTRTGKRHSERCGRQQHETLWLEAGGKSANIVFADCPDLQKAASATAAADSLQPGAGVYRRNAPVAGREHRR
ncbi:aldehyde dehydrogenase family protein [Escherichia coli]